jgi:hypothetical protein
MLSDRVRWRCPKQNLAIDLLDNRHRHRHRNRNRNRNQPKVGCLLSLVVVGCRWLSVVVGCRWLSFGFAKSLGFAMGRKTKLHHEPGPGPVLSNKL